VKKIAIRCDHRGPASVASSLIMRNVNVTEGGCISVCRASQLFYLGTSRLIYSILKDKSSFPLQNVAQSQIALMTVKYQRRDTLK